MSKKAKPEKTCFVISPIGSDESETRRRSDLVLKHVIRPATEECGYRTVRADELDDPGVITSQVIQRIIEDEMVVADLTERNPNVFYELALRHAIRKPLIQLIEKGESIPFDVAGMRTISVDHRNLESADLARKEIVRQIRSAEGKTPEEIESPIGTAIDLMRLRQSGDQEKISIARILEELAGLRRGMDALRRERPRDIGVGSSPQIASEDRYDVGVYCRTGVSEYQKVGLEVLSYSGNPMSRKITFDVLKPHEVTEEQARVMELVRSKGEELGIEIRTILRR